MNDKGAIGRSTATKIRDGKIVTPNSYFKLMKWLEKEKPRVKMIMQVHDELVFEVHKDDLEKVSQKIHELMENSMKLDVPLLVEVGSGENWDQAH